MVGSGKVRREKIKKAKPEAIKERPNQAEEGIRALQTVLSSGEKVTVLVMGNSLSRYDSLFSRLAQEIKKRHHPLWLVRGKGIYSRQEIIRYLRENSKVIAIELSNGAGEALGKEFSSEASGRMSFPEVLHWSSMLGLPPEVVLKSAQRAEFSLEKLLEEIGLEKT